MSRKTPADEWGDLDSSDIASVASSELNAHRPNRWTGAPSTWRNLTKDERTLWQSLERIRNEDLGVHLYNAHALKRQGREAEGRKFLTATMEDGKESVWAPPKAWTAWPLKPNELPPTSLLKPHSDEHDHLTFSQPSYPLPSTALRDELNAHILRFAKDRFRRRMAKSRTSATQSGPVFASIEGTLSEAAPSSPGESEVSYQSGRSEKRRRVPGMSDMEIDDDEGDEEEGGPSKMNASRASSRSATDKKKRGKPQVLADDDLSEELLRAPVRHILSQLDRTLMILHHGRVALASNLDASENEDDPASDLGGTSARRKRARSRSLSRARSQPHSRPATPAAQPPGSRPRGRPRKVHHPLEGETPEAMALRIARESHRPNPATVSKRNDAAFEAWLSQGGEEEEEQEEGGAKKRDAATTDTAGPQTARDEGKGWREQKLDRLGLRDWSDVLGAAALAGFSGEVVDRAARRCAKMFGEGVVMRRLEEVPVKGGGYRRGEGVQERVYRPEEGDLTETDVEDGDILDIKPTSSAPGSRRQSISRRSSLNPRSPTPSSHRLPIPSATPPPIHIHIHSSRSRSRSRSATSSLFCPEPTCPRSHKGFDRKANLERHVRLVHGGRRLQDWEVDSDDDVVGGVRVDGFLREIVPEGSAWFKKKRVRTRKVLRGQVDDDDDGGEEEQEQEEEGFESA